MLDSTLNLNTFCVRDTAGNCDVEATMVKMQAFLSEYATSVKADNETINGLILAVFARPGNHVKECLKASYVVSQVVGELTRDDQSEESFDLATARVKSYIESSGLFASKKGPTGGLMIIGRVIPKAEKAA